MRPAPLVGLALLLLTATAHAGEVIRFEPGAKPRANVVLANVPVKGLVTEFLDPGNTGIGKSLGYLMWREVLTAISDQAGAGVILARAPADRRLTDLLERQYHDAAVRIATEQGTAMAAWGAVNAEGHDLFVSTYLSLLPSVAALQLKLRLTGTPPLPPGLEAEITRTNFNFPVVETTRAQLFERRVVIRKATSAYRTAASSRDVVRTLAEGTAVDAIDMEGSWFKLRLPDGKVGYVENAVVDVPPRTVEASGVRTTLVSAPGAPGGRTVALDGSYRVLSMRYANGLWYQLDAGGTRGWMRASLVRPRFSLPIVHFMAGLYRYQFKKYDDARREFGQYVSAPGSAADNATMATAYQLRGASAVLARSSVDQTDPAAVDDFSRAVAATPYDPAAYSLRALSTIAVRKQAAGALADLQQALQLDPANVPAARITGSIHQELTTTSGGALRQMLRDRNDPEVQRRLHGIVTRYPEAGKALEHR